MAKLLIAEDDELIREGLKQLIDWDELGIVIAGEARDGAEALTLFHRDNPDIVLTDIRMPHVDGLALIESIRRARPVTKFVIISGYDDFQYVRKAIHLQVEDYLLKPVSAEELKQVMATCCEKIARQENGLRFSDESELRLKHNILLRWIENRIDEEQLREKLGILQIDVKRIDLYQAGIIARTGNGSPVPRSMAEAAKAFAATEGWGQAFAKNDGEIVVIAFGRNRNENEFSGENTVKMNRLRDKLVSLTGSDWRCALGMPVGQIDRVHRSYQDAARQLSLAAGKAPAVKGPENKVILQMKHYIRDHYNEPLSIKQIADHFHFSSIYLGRLFKEQTGCYFSDYVNEIRINEAKALLRSSTLKPTEIAVRVGYADPNYFFRKFKQLVGISPTQYRDSESEP